MLHEIAPGVAHLPIIFVNAYFVGQPDKPWFLVDSGVPGSAAKIRTAAAERYGPNAKPQCIVLTHGHFDHRGGALELAEQWDVPIYAHPLELPYLTGKSGYPPPDPTIGGFIAFGSRFMPASGHDLGGKIQPLPDGDFLPDWEIIFTPGHAPGHISLFRRHDKTLLAGDALATANMDSFIGMITMKQELARAGAPFNCDWNATKKSVEKLAALEPAIIACGHGTPMTGSDTTQKMREFAQRFSIPSHGRYVDEAAQTNETGVVALPPAPFDPLPGQMLGVASVACTLWFLARNRAGRE